MSYKKVSLTFTTIGLTIANIESQPLQQSCHLLLSVFEDQRGHQNGSLGYCTVWKGCRHVFQYGNSPTSCEPKQLEPKKCSAEDGDGLRFATFIFLLIFLHFFRQMTTYSTLWYQRSLVIQLKMSFSLTKLNNVASFSMQATYPSLSDLFRSLSNVILKNFKFFFIKEMSVNSLWGHVLSISFRS